ncbi:DUF397 domain-containing protein [Streptomyces sp. NBC_00203]|uniref:DUF397 domain-containing protein n=1 Tax=Streptomyces sp. NBC_00203 TaxID=2975680 RepID=UPI00324994A3
MITGVNAVPDAAWFKSSYSGGNETECVETAILPGRAAIRDSKHPDGPRLAFSSAAWADFITSLPIRSASASRT